MRSILKLALFYFPLLFLLNCRDEKKVKSSEDKDVITYRNDASTRITDAAPPEPFRERPGNATPGEMEEMRRQRNLVRAANLEWIKRSVEVYSPASWYLLMEYEKLPESEEITTSDDAIALIRKSAGTFDYLRGRSRIDLLASMETNVHEIAHAYFDQGVFLYLRKNEMKMNTEDAQGYVYISPSKSLYVTFPKNAMFPSGRLTENIPDELRTYRFGTYINGNTSTQSDGIIGLLNEMQAYYLGSAYCFNMLEPYKEAAGSGPAGLFEWVTHTQSTMSAFYEFDFFIKEYLLRMKKDYGREYEMLRSDRRFKTAYSTIHELYSDLIGEYFDRVKKEMELINSAGEAEASIEKGWLWIKAGNSNVSSGAPVFSDDREILIPVLESRRFRDIEKDFPLNVRRISQL